MTHASLWSGTADSWTDLHPSGATESVARAISGGRQVGYADLDDVRRASLWSGSANSWVDLHPSGATESLAMAISGGQQAGYAYVDDAPRASLWSSTADSWVDLHPSGATVSVAHAISDGHQVGYAIVGGSYRASLWSNTATSWEDLSQALTGSWGDAVATGIWSDGPDLCVSGYGFNNSTRRFEALLWYRSVPTPGAAGTLVIAGLVAARRRR
ncbi:MAG: hypothetical protein IT435_19115 [Phycisphaerales bacterium]|nr:hypothetical protein [Phycisphaerales bacterium]